MTMISAIAASVRKRGLATPAEILADIGALDMRDRATAATLIEEMVREQKLEARELILPGFRVPMFRWNHQAQHHLAGVV